MNEIKVSIFPDKGSILISSNEHLVITPTVIIYMLETVLRSIKDQFPNSGSPEELEFIEFLMKDINQTKQ